MKKLMLLCLVSMTLFVFNMEAVCSQDIYSNIKTGSGEIISNDSLGIKIDEVLFFECGKDRPVKQDRQYTWYFNTTSRYIDVEVNFTNLKYTTESQKYNIVIVWKYFNGDEFGENKGILEVNSDFNKFYYSLGYGWPEKGNWPLGRFTAQIFINGVLFAEKDFYIIEHSEEFFTWQSTTKNIEYLQNLPQDIKYKILQHYKIDGEFNRYMRLNISKNGKNVAYHLAYELETETSSTRTYESRHYLFMNNKQIIPAYYELDYNLDRSFNNFAFSGNEVVNNVVSNSRYYYNGYQYAELAGRPIIYSTFMSPDGEKNSIVVNPVYLENVTRQDYLIVNGKKIEPEYLLKNTRIVKISEPVKYIKNEDNTYNAVYTVYYKKYAADNKDDAKSAYTIFNEEEKISANYDFIGIPNISPDEKHLAYAIAKEEDWYVMLDDKIITKRYDKIEDEIFYTDMGKSIIYRARIGKEWFIMKNDEKISDGFPEIQSIVISQDEKHIGYKARIKKQWFVMKDKVKISDEYDEIGNNLVFSPDGEKIAYSVLSGDDIFMMVNNEQISKKYNINDYPIRKLYELSYLKRYSPERDFPIQDFIFNERGDKVAYIVSGRYSSSSGHVMINEIQISPKLCCVSIVSPKPGQFMFAGIDYDNDILHHVEIDF